MYFMPKKIRICCALQIKIIIILLTEPTIQFKERFQNAKCCITISFCDRPAQVFPVSSRHGYCYEATHILKRKFRLIKNVSEMVPDVGNIHVFKALHFFKYSSNITVCVKHN